MIRNTPTPPEHLAEPTRNWWVSVMTDYELQPHHVRLLTLACEHWDRAQEARVLLSFEGLTITGPKGTVANPLIKIHADASIHFTRIVRELDLDCEPPPERRPPPLKSNRG